MNDIDLYQNEGNKHRDGGKNVYQNDVYGKKLEKSRSLYQNDTEIELQNAYQNDGRAEKRPLKKKLTIDDEDVYHTPESEDVHAALRRARIKITALKRIGSTQRNRLKEEAKRNISVEEHIYDGVYELPDSPDRNNKNSKHSLTRRRSSDNVKLSDDPRCISIKCCSFIVCLMVCILSGGGIAAYLLLQDDKEVGEMNTTITEKPSLSDLSGRGRFEDTNFFSSESPHPRNPSTAHIAATVPEITRESDEKLSVIPTDKYPATKFHWINEPQCTWSEWKLFECDATCGDSKRYKLKEMKASNFYKGQCSGKEIKTEPCNLRPCPQDQCPWSKWRETWACSKTCGTGERRIMRHNCREKEEKNQSCNFRPCPLEPCVIKTGKYNQQPGTFINFYSSAEKCAKEVRKSQPQANGMTWNKNTHKCRAEFGVAEIDRNFDFLRTCVF